MDYRNIDEEKQRYLEDKHPAELAAAGLLMIEGFLRGAEVDPREIIEGLHNILVAILVQPD